MNKFDDMMACIAQAEPSFRQLLAVDPHFDVFRRAWCVAELHQAHKLRLQQRMRVFSEASLLQHAGELRSLNVEDMQASNPADRDMILARIADKAAFNAEVQRLLFDTGGLLEGWRSGFENVRMLGEIARKGLMRSTDSILQTDSDSDSESEEP
mmetsp:Transcript_83278/g.147138  ORF Transcript_83278/g.147138 Transcript_83278/m.147138 type:complete len:154 (-) Transcript_83278:20-481(-)